MTTTEAEPSTKSRYSDVLDGLDRSIQTYETMRSVWEVRDNEQAAKSSQCIISLLKSLKDLTGLLEREEDTLELSVSQEDILGVFSQATAAEKKEPAEHWQLRFTFMAKIKGALGISSHYTMEVPFKLGERLSEVEQRIYNKYSHISHLRLCGMEPCDAPVTGDSLEN